MTAPKSQRPITAPPEPEQPDPKEKSSLQTAVELALEGTDVGASMAKEMANAVLKLHNLNQAKDTHITEIKEKAKQDRDNMLLEIDLIVAHQSKGKAQLFREIQKLFRVSASNVADHQKAVLDLKREKENRKMVDGWMQGMLNNAYGIIKDIYERNEEEPYVGLFVGDWDDPLLKKMKEIAENYNPERKSQGDGMQKETKPESTP